MAGVGVCSDVIGLWLVRRHVIGLWLVRRHHAGAAACHVGRNRSEMSHSIVFKCGCCWSPISLEDLEYPKWFLNVDVCSQNETLGATILFIKKWPNFAIKNISWDYKTLCACAEMILVLHAFCCFYKTACTKYWIRTSSR